MSTNLNSSLRATRPVAQNHLRLIGRAFGKSKLSSPDSASRSLPLNLLLFLLLPAEFSSIPIYQAASLVRLYEGDRIESDLRID